VIAYGDTREQAIRRMRIALSEMAVEGIQYQTSAAPGIAARPRFFKGGTSIHYWAEARAETKRAARNSFDMPWLSVTIETDAPTRKRCRRRC